MQTECPKCSSKFAFNLESLKQSQGKVKCGKCMHIFTAADHLVVPESEKKPAGKFQFSQTAIDQGTSDGFLTQDIRAVNTYGEMNALDPSDTASIKASTEAADVDENGLFMDTQETPGIKLDD